MSVLQFIQSPTQNIKEINQKPLTGTWVLLALLILVPLLVNQVVDINDQLKEPVPTLKESIHDISNQVIDDIAIVNPGNLMNVASLDNLLYMIGCLTIFLVTSALVFVLSRPLGHDLDLKTSFNVAIWCSIPMILQPLAVLASLSLKSFLLTYVSNEGMLFLSLISINLIFCFYLWSSILFVLVITELTEMSTWKGIFFFVLMMVIFTPIYLYGINPVFGV